MPRENSFTDSEGRSLTPDLEDEGRTSAVRSHSSHHTNNIHFIEHPPHMERSSVKSGLSKRPLSLRSRFLPHHSIMTTYEAQHPKDRFRAVVHKVISLHRGATLLGTRTVGAEPGIDPSRPAVDAVYKHIEEGCDIEIIDYSAVRSRHRSLNNREFVEFMESGEREAWVKVRWINIGGISWDVIKALTLRHGIHPLALEEIFHSHSRGQSKAEYYNNHLFLRVLCHEFVNEHNPPLPTGSYINAPRSASPEPISDFDATKEMPSTTTDTEKGDDMLNTKRKPFGSRSILPTTRVDVKPVAESMPLTQASRRFTHMATNETTVQVQQREHKQDVAIVDALKQGSRVNVNTSPMFFFLMRDGTLISIRPTPDLSFTAPISYRLKSRDTVVRKSADSSLLLHALLDLIVDKGLQVVDQYNIKLQRFERDILLSRHIETVQELHILSGDLILHKRTFQPIKTLIYGLRRYDSDRSSALVDVGNANGKELQFAGFMSAKSKIYLADVHDHMEYILSSLDMFSSISENLIAYSFNMKSYEMNNVMRRLTVTTIIFLPLTFLSGYFGMNFNVFWSTQNNSDLFFWKLAIPIFAVFVGIALYSDIKELWKRMSKKRHFNQTVQKSRLFR
ncbi:hypothetical protein BDN70DRAFT_929153 [Pholiota conissans]|uniref:Magnesium transport protein CorA n=1 Tax=Pholiota conissans TaxID=109636 RepID=A0A9P5ZCJ4_9AGAR|nr:hypothetical protein BDN70DRAFT_929153 [Pholiota conissans]